MNERVTEFEVPAEFAGRRLDQALAILLPEYSRNRIQHWIKTGGVSVDRAAITSAKSKLQGGEQVRVIIEPPNAGLTDQAEDLALAVVFEDAQLLVIDKPAGLVVHPAAGNPAGTLLNGLLHHAPELAGLPRAGIVHRLDKDTSGLLVVAKTVEAQHALASQLAVRSMGREYRALVLGEVVAGGSIDAPIGRHPQDRKRMTVREGGKPALTHYRVQARYPGVSDLKVKLETGRTHQIRVHLAHIQLPILGDPVYGGRRRYPKGLPAEVRAAVTAFPRQALHAEGLRLQHPASGDELSWHSPIPADMQNLLDLLARAHA